MIERRPVRVRSTSGLAIVRTCGAQCPNEALFQGVTREERLQPGSINRLGYAASLGLIIGEDFYKEHPETNTEELVGQVEGAIARLTGLIDPAMAQGVARCILKHNDPTSDCEWRPDTGTPSLGLAHQALPEAGR